MIPVRNKWGGVELGIRNINMQDFNEAEWMKLVFLLADTQEWIDGMCRNCFMQLPKENKKLFKKDYYLSVSNLAHILERHYYKINRHPQSGKFHIPIIEILEHIRAAYITVPQPLQGGSNFFRVADTGTEIGFDKEGKHASYIMIITNKGGQIITAVPCSGSQL